MFYALSISLPLLRTPDSNLSTAEAYRHITRKRWTLIGVDTVVMVLWIVAAVLGRGAAPHFRTKGINLVALAAIMAGFQGWAIGIVGLSRGFRQAGRL